MRRRTLILVLILVLNTMMMDAVHCYLVVLPEEYDSALSIGSAVLTENETSLFTVRRITSITAGLNHNAAMSVAGEIYMWGSNKHGCLGLGDTTNRALPTKVQSYFSGCDLAICWTSYNRVPRIYGTVRGSH